MGSPHWLGPWSVMQAALQGGAATSRPSLADTCGRPLPSFVRTIKLEFGKLNSDLVGEIAWLRCCRHALTACHRHPRQTSQRSAYAVIKAQLQRSQLAADDQSHSCRNLDCDRSAGHVGLLPSHAPTTYSGPVVPA